MTAGRTRFRFRRATLKDIDLLVRHRQGMWQDMGQLKPTAPDPTEAVYRRWATRQMKARRLVGFIAETTEGEPAASGCLVLYDIHPRPGFPGPRYPYLLSFFTEPRFRKHGLASRIVKETIRWSRENGYRRISLHASYKGEPIYRRFGFKDSREMRLDFPG